MTWSTAMCTVWTSPCRQIGTGCILCVAPPSTNSPPWLCKELAELPHSSTTPVNPLLPIRFSPYPPGNSNPDIPRNTLLPPVSRHLTEIKGSALRELCQCVVTWTDGTRPQWGPRAAPWTASRGGRLPRKEQETWIWGPSNAILRP